jgi:rSAM/selenodomain-associated transferase 1
MSNGLLTFIKNPIKGKAKTRLAATVGDDEALRIYKELLKHTRQIAMAVDVNRYLFYGFFIDKTDDWSNDDFQKFLQIDGDLGDKMKDAFEKIFADGNQKVVIIGSDCASLTPEIVADAFKQLDNHDFVIGPADDGGYYLLGMNSFEPTVFDNMVWSTEEVLSQTITNIEALNKDYTLLTVLSDIDYEEDWKKHGW